MWYQHFFYFNNNWWFFLQTIMEIINYSNLCNDSQPKQNHLLQVNKVGGISPPYINFFLLHIPWENNRPSISKWQTELHKALIWKPFNGQVIYFQTITDCIGTNVDAKLTVYTIKCQKTEAPICKFLLKIFFFMKILKSYNFIYFFL